MTTSDYLERAAVARETAARARTAKLREEYLAIAEAWAGLARFTQWSERRRWDPERSFDPGNTQDSARQAQ
jgi:hypothetical protein